MATIVLPLQDGQLELDERVAWLLCDHLPTQGTTLRSDLSAALEGISRRNATETGPALQEADYPFVLVAIAHIRATGITVPESLEALAVLMRSPT